MATSQRPTTFSLDVTGSDLKSRALRAFSPVFEKALGLEMLNTKQIYAQKSTGPLDYCKRALEVLRVGFKPTEADMARIPKTGPLVVVANHPLGGVEGIALAKMLLSVRPDAKLLVNELLGRIPQMRDTFLFVNVFGGTDATAKNTTGIRAALRHLKDGGVLGVFPSGTVSCFDLKTRTIADPAWNPMIARLARSTGAAVLPVFFEGRNSLFFQAAGLVHPLVRTALLPREMIARAGTRLGVRVGSLIPHRRIRDIESDEVLIELLRARTYVLEHRPAPVEKKKRKKRRFSRIPLSIRRRRAKTRVPDRVIDAVSSELLAGDVSAIPRNQYLAKNDDLSVIWAEAHQIPNVLREIGRLREITFRATGEGSGKSIDLDRFDAYYLHLFVWNNQKNEVVGAYRMGQTDKILPQHGIGGLYTTTLFLYDQTLLRTINPALELGRSFVRLEYQKAYQPLLLLWRGIASFVMDHPHYRCLLGPVSISNEYQTVSKTLMVEFLKTYHMPSQLAEMVIARNPFKAPRIRGIDRLSINAPLDSEDISDLVADLEPDNKGIPILMRQYLKLGAKLLAFNVDPDFGDCVDGLIVVDLTKQIPALDRYFGDKVRRADYLNRHRHVPAIAG